MLANHPCSISLRKSQMFLHFKIITRHSVVIPLRWYHRNIQTARHEYVRQKDIRKTDFVDIFLNHICSSPYPTLHGHLTAFEAIRTSSSHNRQDASSLAIPDGSTTLKFGIFPLGNDIIKLPSDTTSCFHQTAWGHFGSALQLSPCWAASLWLLSKCWSCAPKWKSKTHLKQVNCISYTFSFASFWICNKCQRSSGNVKWEFSGYELQSALRVNLHHGRGSMEEKGAG